MKKGLSEKKRLGTFFLFMFMNIPYGRAAQLFFIILWLTIVPCAAQQLNFPGTGLDDPALLARQMPALAEEVLALYQESNRERYLDNLFKLQVVAGKYADAKLTLASLDELRGAIRSSPSNVSNVRWEIYAKARQRQFAEKMSFDEAFRQSFREMLGRIDDKTAYQVLYSFGTSVNRLRSIFQAALEQRKGKTTIELSEALDLLKKYFAVEAFQSFGALTAELSDEDNRRRYFIEKDVLVSTPNGATLCAIVVRPRVSVRLPALLNFTIYANPPRKMDEALLTAANGYAAVEGLTRGKGCSPDKPVAIEHDGTDAAALVDWISAQSWSDGRVGMFGGSYEGFTQWAAAKHLPKALKAIMPSVTFAPGIDFPMPGGIFQNYGFPWPFYTLNVKTLDDATYNDSERWNRLNLDWYKSGRAYRELDKLDGTPNPIWNRWVSHPDYDRYWQQAIPYKQEFARIKIPVLTTTGYYDDGQLGALYYFAQHYKYNPNAEHYLVIGPYDHSSGQWGTPTGANGAPLPLLGYNPDPVAAIDIPALRYQWFDHVFKGGPKPALLKDKVNYEVMGANVWRHAPSLAAMADRRQRFYLSAARSDNAYSLNGEKPADNFIDQTVDFADRKDAEQVKFAPANSGNWNGKESIVSRELAAPNGFVFVGEPFKSPVELSGLFSGRLDFITNKKDFDFSIQLFELTPEGEYMALSYYWARASYAGDRSRRRLLVPGRRQGLDIESGFLTSRQFRAGSRLVMTLGIIKRADMQLNHGTGRDVSDETIADAKTPLNIKWLSSSFIEIPVLNVASAHKVSVD